MRNLSYCRFENTARDLAECEEFIQQSNDPRAELSEREQKAFDRLVRICRRIADDFDPQDD